MEAEKTYIITWINLKGGAGKKGRGKLQFKYFRDALIWRNKLSNAFGHNHYSVEEVAPNAH